MIRDVCSADIKSVEPIKIRLSQINTGIQYLIKGFTIRWWIVRSVGRC